MPASKYSKGRRTSAKKRATGTETGEPHQAIPQKTSN
jgi:hypothetical protein